METLEIDPDFNIQTSYHNDFFLLRTRVLVNGENTEIRSVKEANRQKTKGAECHLVTAENCPTFVARWKDSKLFDFGALYQEEAKPPKVTSQPISQKDILPGKAVAFSVKATGAKPLSYQWQWRPFGEDEWKNLSAEGSTFQVEEIQACNAGYYWCVVSNSAGSETSHCASLTIVPEVHDLANELKKVIDWMSFGLNLGFKVEELQTIEANYPNDLKRRRLEMFEEWQKKLTPTWSAVVQALMDIGMRRLASELAQKHGVSPPKLPGDETLKKLTNISQHEQVTGSKLHNEVQKRTKTLEQDCRKVGDAEKRLKHSQESKSAVNEKSNQVLSQIEELHKTVRKIVQEKKILMIELQSKQRECQLLSEIKAKDAALEEKINKKKKKIEKLEKELQRKESDLQSALQEAKIWQEKLSRTQVELKKKHEEVKELREEKEKLTCSFNIEQEQVSKLVQLTVTLTSEKTEMEHQLVSIKEESESRLQLIESCNLNISHLSEEVKQKEATLAQLKSELQSYEQVYGTPEQLLELLELEPQVAGLECKLQEAEDQKQQLELEREAAFEEVEAMQNFVKLLHVQLDEPPMVTSHPKSQQISPGNPVAFTVEATGTSPLSYDWQWKPAAEDGSEEWQPCPAEWSDDATLTIPNVKQFNEGSYRCVIRNCVGTHISKTAQLSVAEPPRITTHPQELKNTVPGNLAKFTIQAIGTEPLSYHWQWKLAAEDGSEEWQPCDPEWSDGATLTIPSVQKSNEGSYRCVIRNCVGTMVSKPAQLSVVCSSLAITSEEQARRLRMTQARVEEEVVVSCKLHKKRRKKTKKVSSRYSNDIEQDHPDTDTPTLPSLNLSDYDTVPEEHSSELTVHDTCTQAISEHATSEEAVTTITTDAEGMGKQEMQELIHGGQREKSSEESSPTPDRNKGNVAQATDQEGFFMADTSGEMDSVQFMTEDGRGLAEEKEKGGRLSSEEDLLKMVMFEDCSLLESVVDTALHSHTATPNIDQGIPVELSSDPLYLNKTCTEAELSLSGSKSDPKSRTSSASMTFEDSSLLESAVDTAPREPSPKYSRSSSDPSDRGDPFSGFSQSPECSTSVQPLGYSLSVESKRKTMSPTPERDEVVREGGAEVSDSSHDSDTDSVVVSDYYKLCGTLVQSSSQKTRQQQQQSMKGRLAAFPHRRDSTSSTESLEDVSQQEIAGADIWVPIPHPSRTHLRSVCLSEELLWAVDIRGMVFCTTTESKGRDWQMIQRSMEQITSSSSGKIVWGLHHQNAYVRLGIGMNPTDSTWRNMTKGTTIAHKIKHIAADENGVWVIKIDGQVLFRRGVTEGSPEGRVWQEVGHPAGFTHVACCNETIWAITSSGKVFIRDGITRSAPSGKKWIDVKAPKLMMVALTSNGVVWGVDQESQMGFRCGITRRRPQGKGPWWEVSISALTHPSSSYNSLWQVMSTELGVSQLLASLPPSVSSLVASHTVHHKLVTISASAKVGVVVLEAGSKLHACWRSATGYHYTSACKDGVFQLTKWTKLVVGSTALWLVRDDGELYCLTHEDKLIRIECSGDISLMAASPSVLWAVFTDIVWSRQDMTAEVPEGISWDYIELSTLLQERKLRHIACGNRAAWAIDSTGVPHFRFGVHAREPGTGMSPAWVPVDNPDPLLRITVSPDDWLVWACGENYNVYVRTAVTQDFPVGTAWELVQGERAKELCASSGKVYALTPGGDLLCRFGITKSNLQGNYWRRMPGKKYAHITTSPSGDLWTLDEKGQVWKQECKAIAVSQDPGASCSELEMSMVVEVV